MKDDPKLQSKAKISLITNIILKVSYSVYL